MTGLETFLTVLLVLDALIIILLVIFLQSGNEGGIGSAFGAGNSAGFFGASGGVSFIVKGTWVAGALFFVLSLTLSKVKTEIYAPDIGAKVEDLGVPLPDPIKTPGAVAPESEIPPEEDPITNEAPVKE